MPEFLGSPKIQCFDTNTGEFLAGGLLYTYVPETTTNKATYSTLADAVAGTNANANPVVLDSRGEATVVLSGATKLVLKDSLGNTIWTVGSVSSTTTDILDENGNALLKFVAVASAVNEWTITNAATANPVLFRASGSDVNVVGKVGSKGSGALYLDGGSTGTIEVGTTSTGAINLRRNTAVTGTLAVSGATTLSSTLAVTGNVTMSGTLNILPAGLMAPYGGATAPTGWLDCDGTAVSRTTYAGLFANISTTFGVGDGSTTFNVPDMRRRTAVGNGGSGTGTLGSSVGSTGGAETHTLTTAEMPAHTHADNVNTAQAQGTTSGNSILSATPSATATTGSTGGGGSHNNIQPSLVVRYIIKT